MIGEMAKNHHTGDRALIWIGALKLGKGLLLFIFATGIIAFIHRDFQAIVWNWIETFHFDPDNRYIAGLLDKLGLVDDRKLKELCGLTFFYSAIFLTEGIGLMLRKRWAEFLTVIATASFIPLEVFEAIKHFGPIKLTLLAFNVGIVMFLVWLLRKNRVLKA